MKLDLEEVECSTNSLMLGFVELLIILQVP